MRNSNKKKELRLLPIYFKWIGLSVILLEMLFLIFFNKDDIKPFIQDSSLIKSILSNILILGLFCIAWSKDKHQDEMNFFIRYQAITFSFLVIIFLQFISSLGFTGPENREGVIINMLMLYIIAYYILKYKYK